MKKTRIAMRCIAAFLALILCMSTAVFAETTESSGSGGQNSTLEEQNTPDGLQPDPDNGNKLSYFKGGKVDLSYTGVQKYKGVWYYVRNGVHDASYTGFAQNENGWWYIEKGRVTFKKNGVIKGVAKGKNAWWNVKKSSIKAGPSVEKNSKGWWYIDKEGKVDFKFTGLAKNSKGWWYCQKGGVTFKYNGLVKNNKGTWRVRNSWVDQKFTGIAKYGKKTYYIKRGAVQDKYSGNVRYNGATYKVKKGVATESVQAAMVTKAQGYSSSTGWLVLVDRKHHKLAAFSGRKGNWKLRRYYSIADGHATPNGQFSMGSRFSYYDSAAGNRCWYCIVIKGYYLFHSVLCDPRSSTPRVKNGTVGKTISKGCIRQPVKDAKWLYDTCPRGTKIVIYK